MKKIIIALFLIVSITSFAQQEAVNIKAYENLETEGNLIIGVDTLNSTTKQSLTDTTFTTKEYVDGKAAGLDSLEFDSDYYLRVYLNGLVVDSTMVDSTYHSVYSDTTLYAYEADSSFHALKSDSTTHAVYSDTASVALNITDKAVYSITLPYATTVAGRVALADEGTDYPTGWNLGGVGLDLSVGHNLNRWLSSVSVFAKMTGTTRQQLFNTAAYNGVSAISSDSIIVNSLATVTKDIVIYLTFE